jgi:hypothetical protein
VLEVKSSRKAIARLRGPRGDMLLEHEHRRTRVSMSAPPEIADAARDALITPPPALPSAGSPETVTPVSDSSDD